MKKIPTARSVLISAILIGSVFTASCSGDTENDEADSASYGSTPVDLQLNDGNFYLNGFTDSACIVVKDNTVQLITDEKEKLRELYHAESVSKNIHKKKISENTTGRGSPEDFEEWYIRMCDEWESPKPYMMLFHSGFKENHIAFDWGYDSDGTISFYLCMYYIDENNLESGEGVRFTRPEEK